MNTTSRHPGPVTEPATPIDHPDTKLGEPIEAGQRRPGPVNEDASPLPFDLPTTKQSHSKSNWSQRPWLVTALLALSLLAVFSIWQWSSTLALLWRTESLLALFLSLLTAALVFMFSRAMLTEYRASQRIDQLATRESQVEKALDDNDLPALQAALAPTVTALRKREPALIGELEGAVEGLDTAASYADVFEHLVLRDLDQKADREIERQALSVAAAVAVLPHPALDAMAVLWRASVLIRRIGDIYGLAPTSLSSLRLMKHALTSAIMAAGLDTAGEVLADNVGKTVLGKMAEFTVTVVRVHRLGTVTKYVCRPIPVQD